MTAPERHASGPLGGFPVLLALGLAVVSWGCGDEALNPSPTAGWNAITLLQCPPGRDSVAIDTCTEPFADDTVEFDRLYRQTHEWFGGRFLGAKLSWPPPAEVCRLTDAEGWCFAWLILPGDSMGSAFIGDIIWGAFRAGAPHKLRFWILTEPLGGNTLADTLFTYYVQGTQQSSRISVARAWPSPPRWRSDTPPAAIR